MISSAELEAPQLWQRAPESTPLQQTLASSVAGIWRVDDVYGDPLTQRLVAHYQQASTAVYDLDTNVFNFGNKLQSARTESGFTEA